MVASSLVTIVSSLGALKAGAFPPHPGPFDIGSDSFSFSNPCGSDQTVDIFYPSDSSEPAPIVVYAHGSGGSVPEDFAGGPASLGMVVIAVTGQVCDGGWEDMAHAVLDLQKNPALHPALAGVDWSRIGTFGHSEGGVNAMSFAVWPAEQGPALPAPVSAVVASHGCANVCAEKIRSPIMFTSGSGDRKASRKCWPAFDDSVFAPSKVWASVEGAHHMSPESSGTLNPFTADFLGCHLQAHDHEASCRRIYGNASDGMCQLPNLDGCTAIKHNPVPPAAECDFEQDVDYDTGSLVGQHAASSKEVCCDLCSADVACAAAIFKDSCWFKTADQLAKKVQSNGTFACTPKNKPPAPPTPTPSPPVPPPPSPAPTPAPGGCDVLLDTDCGGDFYAEQQADDADSCCELCKADAACMAWTHSVWNDRGKRSPTCYLKTACGETPVSTSDCTSGKVQRLFAQVLV